MRTEITWADGARALWAVVRTWARPLSEVAAMEGFEQKRDMGRLEETLCGGQEQKQGGRQPGSR